MRLGYCPQCEDQIMVQDVDGKWNSRKKNFGQAYVHFNNFKIKTFLCTKCQKDPDAIKIMSEVIKDNNVPQSLMASLANEPDRIERI